MTEIPEPEKEARPLTFEEFWAPESNMGRPRFDNFHQYFIEAPGRIPDRRSRPEYRHLLGRNRDLAQKLTAAFTQSYEETGNEVVTDEVLREYATELYEAYLIMREVASDEELFR